MSARVRTAALAALIVLGAVVAVPAAAQVAVSSAEIARLQDAVYDASNDISRLRSGDADFAARLQGELDELRDEVIYLRVKMRKEGSVSRSEYTSVRDRIESVRSRIRARGTSGGVIYDPESRGRGTGTIGASGPEDVPVGTELDVRLQSPLSSDTAQVEDRFEATTVVDLMREGRVLIPAGSVMRGVVTAVDSADRLDRKGSLSVMFDQVTINGRSYPIRGTVTQALESEGIRGEAAKIGTGAGVGAIIGGIIGGVRGALAGILIGGGGTVLATEGKDVELPAGTVLRVRLDSGVDLINQRR